MSKIGRKPININNVNVSITGQEIHYKGPKTSGVYVLPRSLSVTVTKGDLFLKSSDVENGSLQERNRLWGLHHALLQNKLNGAVKEFEKKLKIVGLGYKAEWANKSVIKQQPNGKYYVERDKKKIFVLMIGEKGMPISDKGLFFFLGKSHLFYFSIPTGVSIDIDKSGQNLTIKSIDPVAAGICASKIRQLRRPEPYKETGIRMENEVIRRKAGKTKAG